MHPIYFVLPCRQVMNAICTMSVKIANYFLIHFCLLGSIYNANEFNFVSIVANTHIDKKVLANFYPLFKTQKIILFFLKMGKFLNIFFLLASEKQIFTSKKVQTAIS